MEREMAKYGIRREPDGAWWYGGTVFGDDCFRAAAMVTFDAADATASIIVPGNAALLSVALIPTPELTALREIIDMVDGCGDAPQNPDSLPQMISAHASAALQFSKHIV
jgi:hypothetical protein